MSNVSLKRKLILSKESLRILAASQLSSVRGGMDDNGDVASTQLTWCGTTGCFPLTAKNCTNTGRTRGHSNCECAPDSMQECSGPK